ncbi:MAG TPA: flippase [Bryobacteraceae bacterium]|jgi:O-antigen/teichoic acid export membrane protein
MDRPEPAVLGAASEPPSPAIAPAPPRRLAINLLWLSVGEFTAKLLTFGAFSHLARTLGPGEYGFIEFTLAVMVFFSLPVDLGLSSYGAREIARNPEKAPRLLHEITGLRMALSLCSIAALAVFLVFLHKSSELKVLLGLYGASLLAGPFLLQWFFQAYDQMVWVGLASIVRQAGFAGLVFLIFRHGASLIYLGLVECVSVTGAAVFCIYVTRHKMRVAWPWPDLRSRNLSGHLREASPIGLTELAWGFMWYFSTVLLGFIYPDWTLGWFGASHRALMALHTFVWLYFFNLLPSISRCAVLPHQTLLELMDRSVRFTAWIGLFAGGFLTALSPQIMPLLYGPQFRGAAHMFAVLVWMLPIALLSGHHRYILVGYKCQNRLLLCTVASAAASVTLGLALVPKYGGEGAAWALLAANVANLAMVYFSVRALIVEVPIHRQIFLPLGALAVSILVYLVVLPRNEWAALAAACLVYLGCFAWADGRRLAGFAVTIIRKPGVSVVAASAAD